MAKQTPKDKPMTTYDPVQEVRYAMVLNGGVSLAIYINGITQELFKLVRATAPDKQPTGEFPEKTLVSSDELKGTERGYRKLGQFLGSGKCKLDEVDFEKEPVRTRFVIDIISGTSAGGINGVFLAKALANQQEMKPLEALWVDEGDIARLINDHNSVKDLPGLKLDEPPGSLLNSQRMYYKLLEALDKMEGKTRHDEKNVSPYVDELDLYVTASDNEGLLLPVQLTDRVVYEKRHRNVFHFMYATDEATGSTEKSGDSSKISVSLNHFQAKNNPFLAFAARCTSSFPFAFEPMRLKDIDSILEKLDPYKRDRNFYASSKEWEKFYKDYGGSENFVNRAFSDGGELDNIPFGHAIAALDNRRADVPVDRKLIYIDPSPPHPEFEKKSEPDRKPNAIENVTAAVFTLPRTETIREDVERLKERNQQISRLHRITHGLEHMDVARGEVNRKDDADKKEKVDKEDKKVVPWVNQDLTEMIKQRGLAYGGYYRLKVGAVTDDLAELITRVAGFNENSHETRAIQYLMRAWRDAKYELFKPETGNSKKSTQNKFLLNFDFSYRLRRLSFLQKKLDQLYNLKEEDELVIKEIYEITEKRISPSQAHEKENRHFLRNLKIQLNNVYLKLRAAGRNLRSRSKENEIQSPLYKHIEAIGLESKALRVVLERATEAQRMKKAGDLIAEKYNKFNELESALTDYLKNVFTQASDQCRRLINPQEASYRNGSFEEQVCTFLWRFYRFYEDYDMILFPILHSAELGEADEVEIIRISPEDSTVLIDEENTGFRKLAGTAFGNFGAFLDRTWRENDILWGRLDAAERLIQTLLIEYPDQASKLTNEAIGYIVVEEMEAKCRQEFHHILIQPFVKAASGRNRKELEDTLSKFISKLREAVGTVPPQERSRSGQDLLDDYLNPEAIKNCFVEDLKLGGQLQPESTLRSLARITTVVGKIFEGITADYAVPTKPAAWLTLVGRFFWALVEVAVPRSIWNLIAHYWIRLLYLFEILLIVSGTILDYAPIRNFGFIALEATLLVHFLVTILEKIMKLKWKEVKLRLWLGIAVIAAALIGLSVFELQHLGEDLPKIIPWLNPSGR